MSGEHAMALGAVLFLPVGVVLALAFLQRAAPRSRLAATLERRISATPAPVRAAGLLLLTSSAVHASLVPQHLQDEATTAFLFIADAAALTVAAVLTLFMPRVRSLTALLLTAGIVTYAAYVVTGLEQLDSVGVATKIAEAIALALLVVSARRDPSRVMLPYDLVNTSTLLRT